MINKKNIREFAMYLLGVVVVLTTGYILVQLFKSPVPAENKDALMMALGSLLAAFGTVVGYFYGSSAGSANKTEAMTKTTEEQKP